MSQKPSLEIYNKYKEKRGLTRVGIYHNSRGSTLLALARAGMLPTRKYRSKFQTIYSHCIKCGIEEETIRHVLMECTPHHFDEGELPERLGLVANPDREKLRWIKELLERWEEETRKIC